MELHKKADELFDRVRGTPIEDPAVRDLLCELAEVMRLMAFVLRDHSQRIDVAAEGGTR